MLARDRNTLGGLVGIGLLALAFAYRWVLPPDWLANRIGSASPQRATRAVEASTVAARAPAPAPVDGPTGVEVQAPRPAPVAAAPVAPTGDDMPPGALDVEAERELARALTRAAAAAAEGRHVLPPDDCALYWYDAALAIDPRDRAAREGRRAALDAGLAAAAAALDAADFDSARELLVALSGLPEIARERAALAARLATLPRLAAQLAEAARRLAAGRVYEPSGDSALDAYREALALDPGSAAAREGLESIEAAVLSAALAAASEDRFDESSRLLGLAAEFLPGTQAQLETRGRILALRRDRAAVFVSRATMALDAGSEPSAQDLIARAEQLGADAETVAALRARLDELRVYARFKPGERFRDNLLDRGGTGPEMVVLPLGEFRMGSPDNERGRKSAEGPQHLVRIRRPFALARTETTVAQFRAFVDDSGYVTDAERLGGSSVYDESSGRIANRRGVSWRRNYAGDPARDREPVVHVSWNDAVAYAAWLAERTGQRYRLPSEAEFEYALRAGSGTRYWWGDGEPETVVGNFTGDGDRSPSRRSWTRAFSRYGDDHWGPARVGSYAANPFGLHDIDGNVSEWVEDCWHDSYLRAPDDGSAWVNPGCGKRVARGGSWGSAPDQVRSAYRVSSAPEVRGSRIGFRVARDLGAPAP